LKPFSSFLDPERWTNIPLLVKILKLIINELSNIMEANAARQATPAEWSQGAQPFRPGRSCYKLSNYQFGLFSHQLKKERKVIDCLTLCSSFLKGLVLPFILRRFSHPRFSSTGR
jgi:hypothetical protein